MPCMVTLDLKNRNSQIYSLVGVTEFIYSMATLQPQRVQHFTQECSVSCYTIFLWAPESKMDIIQLHRIKKKHLKNKQRNTIKYILKKNDNAQ